LARIDLRIGRRSKNKIIIVRLDVYFGCIVPQVYIPSIDLLMLKKKQINIIPLT